MMTEVKGDLFQADVDVLVAPVNVVGAMGAGAAKGFKKRWPDLAKQYVKDCMSRDMAIGFNTYWPGPPAVICLATKRHWQNPAEVIYVTLGLASLVLQIKEYGIRSLAMPRLACGLGGLNWEKQVRPLVENFAAQVPETEVFVYDRP
jgi:O-acetyl-ADP-ribose deacetylase (regulator of RNase III)